MSSHFSEASGPLVIQLVEKISLLEIFFPNNREDVGRRIWNLRDSRAFTFWQYFIAIFSATPQHLLLMFSPMN